MAQSSTVYRVTLHIADIDRNYYHEHRLTLAKHPSETDERLMMRILAFALYASDRLSFAQGLTSNDEPDIWEKDFSDAISLWIDVGSPDEKLIKKACSRSKQVVIVNYGNKNPDLWLGSIKKVLDLKNLKIITIANETSQELASLAQRSMDVHYTKESGAIWLSCGATTMEIETTVLKDFAYS